MPVSRVVRYLDSRWSLVLDRARSFSATIPGDGVSLPAYVEGVLSDVDPALIDGVLKALHAERAVWVRRNRGDVRLFALRPSSIKMPKDIAASSEVHLCSAVAGHMLALSRSESARRRAQDAGDAAVARGHAEALAIHAVRALHIIRQHHTRGMGLEAVRAALHDEFAEPAVAALVRREGRLSLTATAEDLEDPQAPPRPKRMPRGLALDDRVLKLVERSGGKGVTRTDLAAAIRPKPKADDLDAITSALEEAGLIVSGRMRLRAAGQPGTRFFTAGVGLPFIRADGIAVVRQAFSLD